MIKPKLIRITTVPLSLDKLLEGQLRFMRDHFEVIAVSSDKPYLESVGDREGVSTFHLEMTRKITPLKDLIAVIKLFLFFKRVKPDVVHTHTPKAGVVGMLAAKLAGIPNRLHTVAGLPLLEAVGKKRKLLDIVEKITYSCATKIYSNSEGLKQIITELRFCTSGKIKVIGNGSSNGIDTMHFDPSLFSKDSSAMLRNKLNIGTEDFVFIFIGRLVSDKGLNELVQAFANVSRKINKIKLLLIGPLEMDLDPLHPETMNLIAASDLIINVGYQKDVRPYFALADALVFPSYREGFPNVVLQAGAMGLPAIVSNINGCNEIIINAENGLIIPVKNQPQLEVAMESVLNNKKAFDHMKGNARHLITTRFEQKIIWQALLAEYNSMNLNVS